MQELREQFGRFDPTHHNGFHNQNHKDHTTPGYPANAPKRPAIRMTWLEAVAFCERLTDLERSRAFYRDRRPDAYDSLVAP